MVGRRGEAPLAPPYKNCGPNNLIALVALGTLLSLFGVTPRIRPGRRERAEFLAVDRCGNHSQRRV